MIRYRLILPALSLAPWLAFAGGWELYKLRFREGATYCAIAQIPERWRFAEDKQPNLALPGVWELRRDPDLPNPGFLLRLNGGSNIQKPNWSLNMFRFEWTGEKPHFESTPTVRWGMAKRMDRSYERDYRMRLEGNGDDMQIAVQNKRFRRTGKHWPDIQDESILSEDGTWLVLQSGDGRIVHNTIFGPGPDRVVDGLAHIDVYHVPTGQRTIRLEVKQNNNDGLDVLFGETRIHQNRYLFIRVDPSPMPTNSLVCKLPENP